MLPNYLSSAEIPKTLAKHHLFTTTKPEWRYIERFSLYPLAATAFKKPYTRGQEASFQELFQRLKSKWQLIRPAKLHLPWKTVWQLLYKKCAVCSASNGLTLANLQTTPRAETRIYRCLDVLRDIKRLPSKTPSIMAISKLLHFYNPNLFPIYDGKYVENGALRAFSKDWAEFSDYPHIKDQDFQKYVKYMYFASSTLRPQLKNINTKFSQHLKKHLKPRTPPGHLRPQALIFEFLLLGAYNRKIS